jgi:FK506-binding protein 2
MEAVFETELMSIAGVEQPKPVSSASETVKSGASSVASSVVEEATEGIKEKIMDKVAEAAEAVKVTIQDTDGDGQEHNEL